KAPRLAPNVEQTNHLRARNLDVRTPPYPKPKGRGRRDQSSTKIRLADSPRDKSARLASMADCPPGYHSPHDSRIARIFGNSPGNYFCRPADYFSWRQRPPTPHPEYLPERTSEYFLASGTGEVLIRPYPNIPGCFL